MAKQYSIKRTSKKKEKSELTKYERWVYEQVRHKFKTSKEILELRNKLSIEQRNQLKVKKEKITRQFLSKTIHIIEEKLEMNDLFGKETPVFKQKWSRLEPYRVHAKGFTIKVKHQTNKYIENCKNRNKDRLDNNTLQLHKNKIVVYSNKDFFGENPDSAVDKSELYWTDFLRKLEKKYDIRLFKFGIEMYEFRNHIAHINNPIAKKELSNKKGIRKIYDNAGVLRFEIDNSFNFKELEAVHKEKYHQDMNQVDRLLVDIAENPNSLLPSEITNIVQNNLKEQETIFNQIEQINLQIEKSMQVSDLNQSQINILIQSQKIQANQITNLNQNMESLIKLMTPREIKPVETFKPNMEYFN